MKNSKAGSGGIKTFFLYNIEKLILAVSLILLGLFFYLGMSSDKFEKSPDKLVQEANQATSYIESESNWKEIAMYRKGDVAVVDRVKAASTAVDASKYKVPGLSMVPKALQLRMDPPLPKVQDVEAHVLRTAVILQIKQTNYEDPILRLPLARAKGDPDAKNKTSMMGMGGDDYGDSYGDAMGGPPSRSGRNKKKGKQEKDPQEDAEVDAWWGFPGVQEALGGIRPKQVASAGSDYALNRNVVVVNALVDHKTLWKQHEQTLSSSLGYYPKRDLPRYDYLQVQKRVVKDGQPGQWSDISTFVNFKQAELYPSSFTSAPETVPPENYDQYLTNAIPPILGKDYSNVVVHSKLSRRVFKVPEKEDEGVATADVLEGKEELEKNNRAMVNPDGTGVRRTKKGLSGSGAGGGYGGGYGGGMGGYGGGMDDYGGGGMGYGMRTGDGRSSSDLTEYEELADPVLEPTSDFKQIRFFDMSVSADVAAVYEYRMRVWVADPNNADESAGSGMSDYGGEMDGMAGMGGPGGMMAQKDGEEAKKVYKKTKINFEMQDQSVRNRIKRGREDGPLRDKVYFVSEVYEGSKDPVEIEIPKGEEYLRFARPTQWSDSVKIAVAGPSAKFFAEQVAEPRTARVGTTEIPVEETKAEIVTVVEDKEQYGGSYIAAKRLFSIGDLLNFTEPVTILHPIAQSIHFIEDANIRSNGVLIDVMGGGRLEVSRNEPMQYNLPGETLIMDKDGAFVISNDIEDLKDARHALRLPDEKAEYGGKKAARRAKQEAAEMKRGGGGYQDMEMQ